MIPPRSLVWWHKENFQDFGEGQDIPPGKNPFQDVFWNGNGKSSRRVELIIRRKFFLSSSAGAEAAWDRMAPIRNPHQKSIFVGGLLLCFCRLHNHDYK